MMRRLTWPLFIGMVGLVAVGVGLVLHAAAPADPVGPAPRMDIL